MARALLAVFLIVGCASGGAVRAAKSTPLTPEQEASLAAVVALIEAAARAYKAPPPNIIVADYSAETFAGAYWGGSIMFPAQMLTSLSRDMVAAHEMGHYVLGHHHPSNRPQEEKEYQANIEAVRILQVSKGMTEAEALREVLIVLERGRIAVAGGGAKVGQGHPHPCEEIRVVVAAYPGQRRWASTLECAPQER
jgi:hypothetical protein